MCLNQHTWHYQVVYRPYPFSWHMLKQWCQNGYHSIQLALGSLPGVSSGEEVVCTLPPGKGTRPTMGLLRTWETSGWASQPLWSRAPAVPSCSHPRSFPHPVPSSTTRSCCPTIPFTPDGAFFSSWWHWAWRPIGSGPVPVLLTHCVLCSSTGSISDWALRSLSIPLFKQALGLGTPNCQL